MSELTCCVCGGQPSPIVAGTRWTELVSEWQLAPHEHAYRRGPMFHDPHHRRTAEPRPRGSAKKLPGSANTGADDYVVQTEFGADMWSYRNSGRFHDISINVVDYPSALAPRKQR